MNTMSRRRFNPGRERFVTGKIFDRTLTSIGWLDSFSITAFSIGLTTSVRSANRIRASSCCFRIAAEACTSGLASRRAWRSSRRKCRSTVSKYDPGPGSILPNRLDVPCGHVGARDDHEVELTAMLHQVVLDRFVAGRIDDSDAFTLQVFEVW